MICWNVGSLYPRLPGQKIIDPFRQDNRIRIESFITCTNTHHLALLLDQLLNKNIGSQEGIHRIVTFGYRLFHFISEPAVESGSQYDDSAIGRAVKMG